MSPRLPLTEEELVPPSAADVALALETFAASVRAHYGERLKGLYLFGSRARGDNRPNSDADIAVVIEDGDWIGWKERSVLVGFACEPTLESGMLVQAWPVPASAWKEGGKDAPAFVRTALRDAKPIP